MDTNPRVFERAAEIVEERGWWKKSFFETKESVCIQLATSAACDDYGISGSLYGSYYDQIAKFLGVESIVQVWSINDAKPQSEGKQWTIDTLRAIARDIEKENRDADVDET